MGDGERWLGSLPSLDRARARARARMTVTVTVTGTVRPTASLRSVPVGMERETSTCTYPSSVRVRVRVRDREEGTTYRSACDLHSPPLASAPMAPKKKPQTAGKKPKEMLLVQSKVREYIRDQDKQCATDLIDALNDQVGALLDAAVRRAEANGRKTARACDI